MNTRPEIILFLEENISGKITDIDTINVISELIPMARETTWKINKWDYLKDIYIKDKMCRWHHPYGSKQRGTKEPLDEGGRGEWKRWLKTQHSKN